MTDFAGVIIRGINRVHRDGFLLFFAISCMIPMPSHADQLVGTITVRVHGQGRTEPLKNKPPPDGVGPLVPVAGNRDEAGRAKNRRVELLEQ
jgi:hypothetical protein